MQIAKAAVPPFGQQAFFAVLEQLHHHFTGFEIADDGAHWHAQHNVRACGAKLVRTTAGLAIARLMATRIAVVDEGIDVAISLHEDVTAPPAIPAIGSTKGNEFLATETHTAAAAVASCHVNGGFVNEFHGIGPAWRDGTAADISSHGPHDKAPVNRGFA